MTYEQTKEQLEQDAAYLQSQQENLTRLLIFRKKELELEEIEK